jgi:hypothetical protein
MGKNVTGSFINALIVTVCFATMYGFLFPLLGTPAPLLGPLFIGSLTMTLITLNNSLSFSLQLELEDESFITYQMTLPVPKRWLFAKYCTSFMLQTAIISFPALWIGLALLKNSIPNFAVQPLPFLLIYLLSLLFFGLFFLAITFLYTFRWARANLWMRRLDPLIFFSPIFFTYKSAAAMLPWLTPILLCNPFTYITEGLRATIFFDVTPLTWQSCALALALFNIAALYLLKYAIVRRLDPV